MSIRAEYPFSMDEGDPKPRYHIVLKPLGAEPAGEVIQSTAKLLDMDLYMARQMLLSSMPRILTSYVNTHQANPECEKLRALGLEAFVVEHEYLFGGEPALPTRTVEFDENVVGFFDKRYNLRDFKREDIKFIVKGRRIPQAIEAEKAGKKVIADVGVQDFGFGRSRFSLDSNVKIAQRRFDSEIEYFLLLFADSPVPAVELGQNAIHYDFLGESKDSATANNFNLLTDRISLAFPDAQWDESLCHGILLETRTNERNYRMARLFERPIEELTARLYFMTRSGWKLA